MICAGPGEGEDEGLAAHGETVIEHSARLSWLQPLGGGDGVKHVRLVPPCDSPTYAHFEAAWIEPARPFGIFGVADEQDLRRPQRPHGWRASNDLEGQRNRRYDPNKRGGCEDPPPRTQLAFASTRVEGSARTPGRPRA